MNDSRDNPKSIPPDDFAATTPNIKVPGRSTPAEEKPATNDWEKTNYNYQPKEVKPDDWNKTAYNIPKSPPPAAAAPPPAPDPFPKPSNQMPDSTPDNRQNNDQWQVTQANIQIPGNQTAPPAPDNSPKGQQTMYGATKPLIQLPDELRRQYQNAPPTPAEKAALEKPAEEKKRRVPVWLWALGGIFLLAFFGVIFGAAYYLLMPKSGFDVIVKNAPTGSDVRVNGVTWNMRSEDGSYKLLGLKADEIKKIEIVKAGITCAPLEITGASGETKVLTADCAQPTTAAKPAPKTGCDPSTFGKNDVQKSHDCAYEKLHALTETFTVQELLDAMNLYIINFESGKFDVKPEDAKFLEEAAGYMKKLPPNVEIEVGGHTDNVGNDASNLKLSESRSAAVKTALTGAGIKSAALSTRGFGKEKPKDTNDNDDGRFRNRRIEYSAILR